MDEQVRTVTGLVRDLTDQFGRLLRDEFALMKAEMGEKASQAGKGAALIGVGAVFGLCGLLVLLSSAVIALGDRMELWLAALIVGAAAMLVCLAFILSGRANLKADKLMPERTMSSVRNDLRFSKAQMKRSS